MLASLDFTEYLELLMETLKMPLPIFITLRYITANAESALKGKFHNRVGPSF